MPENLTSNGLAEWLAGLRGAFKYRGEWNDTDERCFERVKSGLSLEPPAPTPPPLERDEWTPQQALEYYAAGRHFDVVNGRTRIIDTGAIASDALKQLSAEYATMKGLPEPPSERNEPSTRIDLTDYQVDQVSEFLGGDEPCALSFGVYAESRKCAETDEEMSPGLYVWCSEYPEEGQLLLKPYRPEVERMIAEIRASSTKHAPYVMKPSEEAAMFRAVTKRPVEGVVRGSSLEQQIQSARKAIDGWPPDVKAAMGIAEAGATPITPEYVIKRVAELEAKTQTAAAYDAAMMAAGVPWEAIAVYDSNSQRRVGLARHYEERLYPYVARDGHADISGTDLLRAMVAAFNCMLELRPRNESSSNGNTGPP